MHAERLALSVFLLLPAACDDGDADNTADAASVDAAADASTVDASTVDASAVDASAVDAATADAAIADAATADAGTPDANGCEPVGQAGTAGSNPDLFGEIVYFGGPAHELPAGRYRVRYLDGCMKYASPQAWTVHALPGGSYAWWMGKARNDMLVQPPGTTGHMLNNGGFADFEACVAANRALPPIELDFAGGPLGVWLSDSPFSDNVTGVDGRNPSWEIVLADTCPAGSGPPAR